MHKLQFPWTTAGPKNGHSLEQMLGLSSLATQHYVAHWPLKAQLGEKTELFSQFTQGDG
jgi:hypothetical protein